jgi:hypothetical protein
LLIWVVKSANNQQLKASSGNFDNFPVKSATSILLPNCVYLSPTQVILSAVNSDQPSDLIPSEEVRSKLAENSPAIRELISALPPEQRLAPAGKRDVAVNIEPSINQTAAASGTPNAKEALRIASEFIRGEINIAAYEQRRKTLFSRLVSETARQVLGDPLKRAAISRMGTRDSLGRKIRFKAGVSKEQLDQISETTFAIRLADPSPSIVYPSLSEPDQRAVNECLGNDAVVQTGTWPVPVRDILDVLQLNDFQRKRNHRSREVAVPVLVVDTGFPLQSLSQIRPRWNDITGDPTFYFPDSEMLKVSATPRGSDDSIGVDATQEDPTYNVEPPKADAYREAHHGMWVGSLVLGGTNFGFFRSGVGLPIQLHFAKALARVPSAEYGEDYTISREALTRSVRYALQHRIHVINWSISTPTELRGLEDFLGMQKEKDQMLFVSAAGDEGADLASESRWPASYGGLQSHAPSGTTFITVGAIRADGEPQTRSNRGGDYVDVLAPGCAVLVPELSGSLNNIRLELKPESGTSVSAPIVTFVGALLMGEGLTPAQIKTQLIVSAVHKPKKLAAYAMHGSVLDPVAALTLYHDFVELYATDEQTETQKLRGFLADETLNSAMIDTCETTDHGVVNINDILAIDHDEDGEQDKNEKASVDKKLNIWFSPPSNVDLRTSYSKISCRHDDVASNITWKMRVLESGRDVEFSLKDVKRFIRRFFLVNPSL